MLISELCVAAKAHRRGDWRQQQVQQSNGGKADPENGNKSQEPWRPVETVDGQIERSCQYNVFEFNNTLHQYKQGSFPAGTPGNGVPKPGVPKVILTVGTQLNHANQLYVNCTKSTVYTKIRPFKIQNRKIVLVRGRIPSPPPHLDPCAFGTRTWRSQGDFLGNDPWVQELGFTFARKSNYAVCTVVKSLLLDT